MVSGSLLGSRPAVMLGGKSGQHRIRQSLTATGGNSRESATETIPPRTFLLKILSKKVRGKGERSEVRAHS